MFCLSGGASTHDSAPAIPCCSLPPGKHAFINPWPFPFITPPNPTPPPCPVLPCSMDFPKAPLQLSQFLGMCINANALGLDVVPQLLEGDLSAEVRLGLGLRSASSMLLGGPVQAARPACRRARAHLFRLVWRAWPPPGAAHCSLAHHTTPRSSTPR